MNRFICQVLIVAFSCNVLLPNTALFAQSYIPDYAGEIVVEDPADQTQVPFAPIKQETTIETPWAAYSVLADMKAQEPKEDLLGRPINYDADKDARLIKRGIVKKDAHLRQFLANAPKDQLIEWLTKNELPQDSYQIGMNEYIPGLHLKKATDESAKAALKNLTLLNERGELLFDDFIDLLSAPAPEIASFAGAAINANYQQALLTKDPATVYTLLGFSPTIQTAVINRLNKAYNERQINKAVTPGHRLVQKLAPEQTETYQSVEMRGMLNLILADIYSLYKLAQDPNLRPALEEQDRLMWPMGEYSFLIPDPKNESFYKDQKDRLLHSLDYTRTLKERVMGINNERVLNADYVALTLITYDGIAGFKRLVDYIDADNTNLKGEKRQNRLDQYNFPFLKSAFDYLAVFYLPQISSRETAMNPNEQVLLVNTLIYYTNNGSAPVKVLAMDLLTRLYAETAPKWTRGQGYDKGAKGGLAVSKKIANQIADRIKAIYCRIDQSNESVYGLNSEQMQEMAEQLATAYNRVRRDAQGNFVQMNDDGRTMKREACYVRNIQTRNRKVQAQELHDETMGFILSWVAFGGAIRLIGKGFSYVGCLARTANQARKLPAGQRIAFFKGTLKQMKQAKKAAQELSSMGVRVERVVEIPAKKPSYLGQKISSLKQKLGMKPTEKPSSYVVNALTENNPTGKTLGYQITQRFPGGKVKITNIDGEVVSRAASSPLLPVKAGAQKGTLRSVTELADKYVTKIPEGVSPAAYKEAIATENLLRSGLERVSASNFRSGFGMKKIWYTAPEGKLGLTYEPVWKDLSKSSLIMNNGAGFRLTGNIRKDLLKTVTTPGGVTTAAFANVGEGGLRYVGNIGTIMGGFAAADVLTQPISQALDGQYQNAPEGAPWYAHVGQYFKNVGNAIMHYDEAAGNSLFLPFVAAWDGVSWVWNKTIASDQVNGKEKASQIEDNPYLKEYREKAQQMQETFNKDVQDLVTLWKQAQTAPEDIDLQLQLSQRIDQLSAKYGKEKVAGINSQWQNIIQALYMGINPLDPPEYSEEDFLY